MWSDGFKPLNHIVAIVLFVIVSFGYFHPLFRGEDVASRDMMAYAGAAQRVKRT